MASRSSKRPGLTPGLPSNAHTYARSSLYGNERFKPYSGEFADTSSLSTNRPLTTAAVVRTPEDAAHSSKQPFDYVLLCVKALPDVYDIANIIESVVSPQHTCILMNTTHSLGVESYLEQRFPTNVVLSLVSGAEITQLGASEFEHLGATDIWVGPASKNAAIPAQIQSDMAEALAMTLSSGQVDCKVAPNIRQHQFERMIGYVTSAPLRSRLTHKTQSYRFSPSQRSLRDSESC